MPNLDPHPANILDKGILPPEREAALLAQGAVFGTLLPSGTLLWGSAPVREAANRILRDAYITHHNLREPMPVAAG